MKWAVVFTLTSGKSHCYNLSAHVQNLVVELLWNMYVPYNNNTWSLTVQFGKKQNLFHQINKLIFTTTVFRFTSLTYLQQYNNLLKIVHI